MLIPIPIFNNRNNKSTSPFDVMSDEEFASYNRAIQWYVDVYYDKLLKGRHDKENLRRISAEFYHLSPQYVKNKIAECLKEKKFAEGAKSNKDEEKQNLVIDNKVKEFKPRVNWSIELLKKKEDQISFDLKNQEDQKDFELLKSALEVFFECYSHCNGRLVKSGDDFVVYKILITKNFNLKKIIDDIIDYTLFKTLDITFEADNVIIRANQLTQPITPYDAFTKALEKKQNSLELFMGLDVDGEPILKNLSSIGCILMAGRAASGKTVGINQMLAFLTLTNTPEDVKFILMDHKGSEFSVWADSPYLHQDILKDIKDMALALEDLIEESTKRKHLLSNSGCRNIEEYNNNQDSQCKMSHLVVVVDELYPLMQTTSDGKSSRTDIALLLSYGRVCGIHFIIASQSVRADMVNPDIRNKSDVKVCYSVSSTIESLICLGKEGAEKIEERGSCLIAFADKNTLEKCQTTFITDEQLKLILNKANSLGRTSMPEQLKNDYLDQVFEDSLKKGTITERAAKVFKELIRKAIASKEDIQISLEELDVALHPHALRSETGMDLRELIRPEIEALIQTKVHVATSDGGMVATHIFSDIEVTAETGLKARLTQEYRELCAFGE